MSERDGLNLAEGAIVALPFFETEKFIVGSKRGGGMGNVYQLIPLLPAPSHLLSRRIKVGVIFPCLNGRHEFGFPLGRIQMSPGQ